MLAALGVLPIATPLAADVCVEADVRVTSPAPPAALLSSMTSEVDVIWKPHGVRIHWTGDVGRVQCPSIAWFFEVHVSDEPRRRSTARPLALGTTWVSPPTTRQSVIYVDYAATRRVLGSLSADWLNRILGRRELTAPDEGRALGRVLAHEIGHGLLGVTRHERRGLMRATFIANELVGHWRRGYTLSDSEVVRLRERERHLGSHATAGVVPAMVPSARDD
jgi:hypothetical protein